MQMMQKQQRGGRANSREECRRSTEDCVIEYEITFIPHSFSLYLLNQAGSLSRGRQTLCLFSVPGAVRRMNIAYPDDNYRTLLEHHSYEGQARMSLFTKARCHIERTPVVLDYW
jgi:hypothetical protein